MEPSQETPEAPGRRLPGRSPRRQTPTGLPASGSPDPCPLVLETSRRGVFAVGDVRSGRWSGWPPRSARARWPSVWSTNGSTGPGHP